MATQSKESKGHDIEEGILTNTERSDDLSVKENASAPGGAGHIYREDEHNYNSLKYRFWVQVGITSVVSAFCITMMATNNDKEGIYLPVLTGIMGYWLPAPDSRVKRPLQK
ncbi:hypothetical protein ATCVNTS1_190L [Acanthocystis turfacea Chlorella virus NTS-1]|nr:hypothetical protein ATCVNTS1_190L [Acanthocystis turfacea Chlorella virus NTS-1]